MRWKQNEIETAINLNKLGKGFNEIAIELNMTTRGVQTKLNKLGYKQVKLITEETICCENCGNDFLGLIKDDRRFCSKRCAAIFNNQIYPKRTREKFENCLDCGRELVKSQNKYCSQQCSINHKWRQKVNVIENGDISFSSNIYKKYLIQKFGNKCMKCGWDEINTTTGLVPIQLEHKDGNSENHKLSNLELLCPNHHSLTPTFGALNKGNGRAKRREKRQVKITLLNNKQT